jgi:AbrB family looped-hinge helix DNA binding protein
MRTTIDAAGRVVIPKALRQEAGLGPGAEIEVELRDGRIEIVAAGVPMRLSGRGVGAIVEAQAPMPVLTAVEVRDALERARR